MLKGTAAPTAEKCDMEHTCSHLRGSCSELPFVLSKATGNEVFGSVISPTLLGDLTKQTNKQTNRSRSSRLHHEVYAHDGPCDHDNGDRQWRNGVLECGGEPSEAIEKLEKNARSILPEQ
jgi:hypothetical protein